MSDSSGGQPVQSRAPDFFDRLLARHAPAAAPRTDVVRVQPRLAGPFERVEAVRANATEPDATAPLWPSSAQSPVPEGDLTRPAVREVQFRTERERTVVRPERAPRAEQPAPRPAARDLPEAPLLRPAALVAPVPRPAPDAARRTAGRGDAERPSSPSAVSVPTPPGAGAASRVVSAAPRPSAADTTAARDAVRQAAGRRAGRGTEQVVQVQIGRLEVTAAGPATGGGNRRQAATERAGATVSLADYLARGRE
ncbi:hypothetical protein [Streptomyces sp. 2A115]|uniref:hypothetical protein n=1 Tax=Streptomyces sp. 2A115 TaxID=3457439 RepID=UPI003FD4DB68